MPQVRLDILLSLVDKASGALGNVRGALNGLEQRLQTGQKQAAAFNEKWGNTLRLGQQVGAGMTAAGAGIAFVAKSGIEASMELEGYRAKLEVALKDATKAAEMYDWAKKKAASTPFEMADVVDATTRLEMYGLSATEWFDKVGNMAGAMGKDVNQAVEAIADAVSGGGLERLKEFGVSATKLKELGWSGDYSAEGIKTLKSALEQLMERDFGGGMEKMMGTAKGAMSNFSDAVFQIKAAIGDALLPAVKALTPILTSMANVLAKLAATPAGQVFTIAAAGAGALMLAVGPLLMVLPSMINGWQLLNAAIGPGGFAGIAASIAKNALPWLRTAFYNTLLGIEKVILAVRGLTAAMLTEGLSGALSTAVNGLKKFGTSLVDALSTPAGAVTASLAAITLGISLLRDMAHDARNNLKKLNDEIGITQGLGDKANVKGATPEAQQRMDLTRQIEEINKKRAEIRGILDQARVFGVMTGVGREIGGMEGIRAYEDYYKELGQQRDQLVKQRAAVGKRASGGPVLAGGMYLVGENGPELFRPKQSGEIEDADATRLRIRAAKLDAMKRPVLSGAVAGAGTASLASISKGGSSMPQIARGAEQRTVIELRLEPGLIAKEIQSAVQSPGTKQAIVSITRMAGAQSFPQTAY